MELNLLCLYKVVADSSGLVYKFNTKNDIHYKITFSDASSYFNDSPYDGQLGEIFSLSIDKVSLASEPFDPEVRNTVDVILQHFFLDTKKSLLYVCDTLDKKRIQAFDEIQ
jgi:hypothetical protein